MARTLEQVVSMAEREVAEEFQTFAAHLGAHLDITVHGTAGLDELNYTVTINGIEIETTGSIPDFLFCDNVPGSHQQSLRDFVRHDCGLMVVMLLLRLRKSQK